METTISQNLLKEEAKKYALHYWDGFKREIENGNSNFDEHYKRLKFNKSFFKNIIFSNIELTEEFNREIQKKYGNAEIKQVQYDEVLLSYMKRMAKQYKLEYILEYVIEMQQRVHELQNKKTELEEDIAFYIEKRYVEDKEFDDMTEEEVKKEINELTEEKEESDENLQKYKNIQTHLLSLANKYHK